MISVANTSTVNPLLFKNGYDFKSLSIPSQSQSKPIAISLQKTNLGSSKNNHPRFEIEFSDFEHKLSFEIIEIDNEPDSNEIYLLLGFEDNVIKVTLSGTDKNGEGLIIDNYGFNVEKQGATPLSVFLLKTLWAIFGLSSKINIVIPILNQEASMSFNTNLKEISEFLQVRQIAYRAMVIEKACNVMLPFPEFIEGEYVERIAYCFHSIIDRKFDWSCSASIATWFATPACLSLLPRKDAPFRFKFNPEPVEKDIFGCRIDLGLQTAEISDYVIDNFDEVKSEVSKLDGHQVFAKTRSKSGILQIESITTATLPKNGFSKDIQKLIDLDEKLDSMVMDKYFNLVSNAFEGLTNEQIEALTQRPDLNEGAFNF
jgi:hypothetical protein